jgi:membrane bound O-acyltransferase family protein
MPVECAVAALTAWVLPAVLAYALGRARIPPRLRTVLWALIAVSPLTTPLWLNAQNSLVRVLVAIQSFLCFAKIIDYCVQVARRDDRTGFWMCVLYISFWPTLDVSRCAIRLPTRDWPRFVLARATSAVAMLVPAAALMTLGAWFNLRGRSTVVDAVFMAFEVYLLGHVMNEVTVAAFGLGGFKLEDAFRYPLLPRSVLDFWGRHDLVFHHWLKRHVFWPARPRTHTHPALGVLAVFFVSGLAHEYLFLVAVPGVAGRQMAFFLLNGLGGLLGAGLGRAYRAKFRRGVPRPLPTIATVAFLLLTSPLLVSCLDRVFHFHQGIPWVGVLACSQSPVPGLKPPA